LIKKVVILWLVLLMLDTLGASAQPEEEWNKTFGGSGSDVGNSVIEAEDGGYIIAGWTDSFGMGQNDVWLTKTDSKGFEEWNRTYGGTGDDIGRSVMNVGDGYFIVGSTRSHGSGDFDLWLIKTDSEGNKVWDKTFGGPDFDWGNTAQQTEDEGYIVAGTTYSFGAGRGDFWLIKTDLNGNEMWNKTFGGINLDAAFSMVHSSKDGGYVIVGSTRSYGGGESDVWLIKVDSKGFEQWNRTFGGADIDEGRSVQQADDGGYIIAGKTKSYGAGDFDLWLIKTDSDGNEEWNRTFGGSEWDDGFSVATVEDGGYIVTGSTHSDAPIPSRSKTWLIKTDGSGNEQWNRTFAGSLGASIYRTKDGGYIIGGFEELIKLI